MRRAVLAIAFGLATALAAAPSGYTVRALDRRYKRIERLRPRMSVRELFGFALEAVGNDLWPERVEQTLAWAEQMQQRDPAKRKYGNFKWYWEDEGPADSNAVEFSMQQAALIWMFYKDRLTPQATERLDRLIRFSVDGIRGHPVSESYTNIFVMKTWNCIALGEHTARPDLAEEGYQMLDRWLLTVWEEGVHEYLSPTYYGTDLDSLNLIAKYARREQARIDAKTALRLFWADIAANWNEQGQRLGGAHSRDYDYLTGHGYLDHQLVMAKWIDNPKWRGPSIFQQLYRLDPPAGIREQVACKTPRLVHQRWGRSPWERAVQYVGNHFAIGSSGATYGPMDKPLTINLPGHRRTPVVNFFMDGRGDPYGKKRFAVGGGHSKALHLTPFIASVQAGPEVLLFASGDASTGWFGRCKQETTCLLSHLVLPMDVELWLGDAKTDAPKPGGRIPVPHDQAVFLRVGDVGVGIRFPLALTSDGKPAPVELVADGAKWRAMRLTCVHSSEPATAPGQVAVWVRAAEGLDDASFAAFRGNFMHGRCAAKVDGARVSLRAEGQSGPLSIGADLETGRRTAKGDAPGAEDFLLAVDDRDWGREFLGQTAIVKKYKRFIEQAATGGADAPTTGKPIEAESAVFIVPPFRIDADAQAGGGKFLWMPGEPGGRGGSRIARAVWLVNVAKPGTYYLWARVMAPTPDDDSFFVSVRQKSHEALPLTDWHTGVHPQWTWSPIKIDRGKTLLALDLKPGVATIEFGCRENGTRLDAFALTDTSSHPPMTNDQ